MNRPLHTKRDVNHAELVQQLRQLGAVVWDTADLGGRVLDLVVFWRGQTRVVEVKSPEYRITYTESELDSFEELELVGVEAVVAVTVEDVVSAFEDIPFSDPLPARLCEESQ